MDDFCLYRTLFGIKKVSLLILLIYDLHITNLINAQPRNDRPIIGVLTLKITDQVLLSAKPELKGKSYIAASYIKWLESGGARAVAIKQNIKDKALNKLLGSLNGVLLPGGEINLKDSGYYHIGKKIFKFAKRENKARRYFPLFGICRGMQALMVWEHGNLEPLTLTDARNCKAAVEFEANANKSRLLAGLSKNLVEAIRTQNITAHFHKYGITPEDFLKMKDISDVYVNLGTSSDRDGKRFISIIEGKYYHLR